MLRPDDQTVLGLAERPAPSEASPDANPAGRRAERRASNISQALRAIARDGGGVPADAGLSIRPVRHSRELDEVHRITHDAYVERGYCAPRPCGKLVHYPALERIPETAVLVALQSKTVMGTVSITLDGERGLNVDHDFRGPVQAVREEGRALGAVWRLATRRSLRGERRVVLGLIRAAVRQAFEVLELQSFLIVVNPRHESAYRRLLDMQVVARSRGTEGLENAPGVLMRCDLERCPARWRSPS